jgi:FixJ family two-component response regulator
VSWWPTDLREHRFLSKPFEKAQLIAAVRDALSDTGARA